MAFSFFFVSPASSISHRSHLSGATAKTEGFSVGQVEGKIFRQKLKREICAHCCRSWFFPKDGVSRSEGPKSIAIDCHFSSVWRCFAWQYGSHMISDSGNCYIQALSTKVAEIDIFPMAFLRLVAF